MRKTWKQRFVALALAACTILGLGLPAQAISIADGSKTCTVALAPVHNYLTTTAGTSLRAGGYNYTTDDGLTGPAYCIDHGLDYTGKVLPITGKYTASPATAGAFANGYPQMPLQTWLDMHLPENSILNGMTEDEYRYATQVAVWATLGQLGVDGTKFTAGREYLNPPTGDTQQSRVFRAVQLILGFAGNWDRVYQTGMYIRLTENALGGNIAIPANMTLEYAADRNEYGIKREVINGKSYFTREYIFASATSTYYQDYTIDLWATGCPAGTIFTDLNNVELPRSKWHETDTWRSPATLNDTNLNYNGFEYKAHAKLCIPVETAPNSGEITLHCAALVMQYEIYLANNEDNSQQSYIIADPSKGTMEAEAVLSWGSIITEQAYLKVIKVGGGGIVLPGATFTLTGSDGSSYTSTTDEKGEIFWNKLKPGVVYTLTESDPPAGYSAIEPQTLTLKAGHIEYLTIRDDTLHTLTVRKVDRQTGYSLRGAVMRFEQIDGDFTTTAVTDHAGNIQMNADQLPVGTFKIYEEVAPEGMELDPTPQTVHWDGKRDVTLTFQNTRKMTLIISKQSSTTGYNLPGATFAVYRDGQYVTSVTTNEAGLAYVHDVKEGYWTVKETAAPLNHLLNEEVQGVYISPYDPATTDDPRIVVKDAPLPSLRIVKYNQADHAGMEGVTFEIFRDGTSLGKFQTDRNGEVLLSYAEPGTYRAVEVNSGDDTHILDTTPQEVELRAGDDVRELVFFNSLLPGVHLIKVDSSDLSKPIANAKFRFEKIGGGYGPVEYTTGADGTIDLSKLPVGSYVVTELECAGYVVDDAQRIIQLQPNTTAQFVFTNTKLPNIRLTKTDTDGKPMEGVTFSLTPAGDGAHSDERTTNAQGVITWEGLEPGLYSLVEVATKSTHVLDATEHHVRLYPGKDAEVTLTNEIKPSLRIVKYSRASHTPLEGVTFEVFWDSVSLGKFKTDRNGEVLLSYVEPGTFRVVEIDSGDDAHILNTTPQEVELKAGDGVRELVFFNDLLPGVHLTKVDSADLSKPIANAKFRFESVKGDFGPVEYTTGKDGTIDLSKLPVGSFIVTELECPGYVVDNGQRIIHLDGNENAEFVFTNSVLPSLHLTKTSADGTPLGGVSYRLTKIADGSRYLDRTTSSTGEITWEGLEPGVYSLLETSTLETHILDPQEYHVELFPGKVSEIVLKNDRRPNLTIHKTNADDSTEPVPDTVFIVKAADGSTIGEYKTGADGTVTIPNLLPQVVEIIEKSVPSPYLLDAPAQTITLHPNRDTDVYFKNHKAPTIEIFKESSITHDPLPNVRFQVWYSSNHTSTGEMNDLGIFTTDENGRIDLTGPANGLRDGWFRVRELSPHPGYALADPDTQEAFIPAGKSHTFRFINTPLSAAVVWKYDTVSGAALSGCRFQLRYLGGGVSGSEGTIIGTYTTSKNGSFTATGLKAGYYICEEIASDGGHVIDTAPQSFYISGKDQDIVTLYFGNAPKGALLVKKVSADEKKTPLADVEFLVTESDGTLVGDANGKFVTDSAGSFLVENVAPGTTLVVKEVRAKAGYLLDDTPQTATIQTGQTVSLEFRNQPLGNLIVEKLGRDGNKTTPLEGVKFEIKYANGQYVDTAGGKQSSNGIYYTNSSGKITLSGIVGTVVVTELESVEGYSIDPNTQSQTVTINPDDTQILRFYNNAVGGVEIIKVNEDDRSERIANTTFEVRRMDGGLVDTITTGKNGRAYLSLEDGDYYAVEVKAGEGFKLDATPHYFTVKGGKTTTLTVTNRAFSGILLRKIDATTKQGIYGATFLLYDASRNPLGQYTSDDRGYVYIDDLPGSGRYYLRELANDGYVLDDQLKTVYVQPGETTEVTWENTPITGQIQLVKTSADYNPINGWAAGTPIPGTEYEVYNRAGVLVDTIRTDKNGVAATKALPLGRYSLVESKAADNYLLDKTPFEVEIEFAGQIVRAAATNESVATGVSVTKTGYGEVMPGQTARYTLKDIANTSNVTLGNFYWRDTLPVESVRLAKVVTGTWNAQGSYKLVYRTNLSGSDYRTLADNLSTQKNYTLDASPVALRLASNEYVTEVMAVFGVVPSGFRQVEQTQIDCTVVSWAAGGSQMVNQADVGGTYNGVWVQATSRWVTKVYAPVKPLPRTGY